MTSYARHDSMYYLPDQITHAQNLIDQAIKRAGTHQPGQRIRVQFNGCFYAHEGNKPPEHYRRQRQFNVTFGERITEQFLSKPSLTMIFEQYGVVLDGVYILKVDSIDMEYIV